MTDIKQECKEKVYAAIEESYICTATTEILVEFLDEVYRKAHAFDEIVKARKKVGTEIGLADYYETEDFGRTVIDIVDRCDSQ